MGMTDFQAMKKAARTRAAFWIRAGFDAAKQKTKRKLSAGYLLRHVQN